MDSGTGGCSVALLGDGVLLAENRERMTRGQAERLAPMVAEVLERAECTMAGLDAVAVSRGPGSFTGLRIGLAFAKGLGQALAIPVAGVSSFEAVARAALDGPARHDRGHGSEGVCVILESRRADLFRQVFAADGKAVGAPAALPPEAIADELSAGGNADVMPLLAGDAAGKVAELLEGRGQTVRRSPATVPEARDIAALAPVLAARGADVAPVPLYLRAPDVTRPAMP